MQPVQEEIITVIARGNEQENSIETGNESLEKMYEKTKQPIGVATKQSSSYGTSISPNNSNIGDTGTGVSISKPPLKGGY